MNRQIDALRFAAECDPCLQSVEAGKAAPLQQMKATAAPLVLVMRQSDLKEFSTCMECQDCGIQKRTGEKRVTIELWRYLRRKPATIPFVRSCYGSAGRLCAGIDALFNQARKAKERNLYLIGVPDAVFEELLAKQPKGTAPNPEGRWPIFLQSVTVDPTLDTVFLGWSPASVEAKKRTMVAASCDLTTLITGEAGTGKEMLARAIHDLSERSRTGKYVALNCAAISPYLLEAELFGCEPNFPNKGTPLKRGLFEIADKGSLFLDEIGNMSLDHQPRVLRAVEYGLIRRVGGTEEIHVDVRLIAATNRNLDAMAKNGEFASDLYVRLKQLRIHTPPLHAFPDDLRNIAEMLWKDKEIGGGKPPLAEEVLDLLPEYTRIGNIRQLKNCLLRLEAYMRKESLQRVDRKYFEDAMKEPERDETSAALMPTSREIEVYRVACLDHLRKTMVAVRKCKVLLRPFVRQGKTDKESVDLLLFSLTGPCDELEKLCLDPSVFHSHTAFTTTVQFKGKLLHMRDLFRENTTFALSYWGSDLKPLYSSLLASLSAEIGCLEQGH